MIIQAVQAALPKGVEVRCHFGNLDETEEELKYVEIKSSNLIGLGCLGDIDVDDTTSNMARGSFFLTVRMYIFVMNPF